jgi:hypothetical protein
VIPLRVQVDELQRVFEREIRRFPRRVLREPQRASLDQLVESERAGAVDAAYGA